MAMENESAHLFVNPNFDWVLIHVFVNEVNKFLSRRV